MKIIKTIIKKCSECPNYIDKMYITGISAYYKDKDGKCKGYMVCGKNTKLRPIVDGNKILKQCPLEDYKEVNNGKQQKIKINEEQKEKKKIKTNKR